MDERIIRAKLAAIKDLLATPLAELGPWQGRQARHLAPGEYEYVTDWQDVENPSAWPALATVFLRTAYAPQTVPAGDTAYLEFSHNGLEGLAAIDGRPYCGVDANHRLVAAPEKPGELSIEAIAIPSAMCSPGLSGTKAEFNGARIVAINPDEQRAQLDLEYAQMTVKAIAPGRRRSLLEQAVEEALLMIDLTRSREEIRRQLLEAGEGLRQRLGAIGRDAEGGRLFLVGHTHIDTAWLWPVRETIRKCGRTFATACRLMQAYPEFHFSCSQAQLFAYTKEHYPQLFEEIRHWVKAGRWHATGAMWVEADCNVTSGESLVRQLLYGLEFFKQEFGVRPRVCWLPDVFGYPASLPQIFQRAGVPYFYTYKLHWQARNPFPDHIFQWEGIDGSRVLAHVTLLQGAYNGSPVPEQLRFAWEHFLQKDKYPELLFPYGHGDGGGGPTAEMLEHFDRAKDYPGLPQCRTGSEEQFFEEAAQSKSVSDVWAGELYLETHRGTYTTHADAKAGNRRCELALRDAEILGVMAAWSGAPVNLSELKKAWELTLLNQFHDILPGSSIGMVYEDTRRDHATVLETAGRVIETATNALTKKEDGQDVCVFNTTSWPRRDPVSLRLAKPAGPVCVLDSDGRELPTQLVELSDTEAEIIFEPKAIAAFSAAGFRVAGQSPQIDNELLIEERRLESPYYLIELAADGSICRLFDKANAREVVPEGSLANELQFYQDGPEHEAAWNIHASYEKRRYDAEPEADFEILERGPVRVRLRVKRRFRASTFVQDLIIYRRLARLDFVTEVDWQERQVLVKAAFALAVRSSRATFEIQFGAFERPTHRNTSWDQEKFEVCGQRWADISEPGFGVSLLNDAKYGHDVLGSRLRLTLLRGPEWPDPEADLGRHRFTYSLLPHQGDWVAGETVRRAAELNIPLRVRANCRPLASEPWLSLEASNVIADTLKPAEDGDGWILRLYEAHGARGQLTIKTRVALLEVLETNLVEENEGKVEMADGAFTISMLPFQLRTFRLRVKTSQVHSLLS